LFAVNKKYKRYKIKKSEEKSVETKSLKDALKNAFTEVTTDTTAKEILERVEKLMDPTFKDDLSSVAYALNYSSIFTLTKELTPRGNYFNNKEIINLIYSTLLTSQIGFNPEKAYEVLNMLMYAKELGYDVTLVNPLATEKTMLVEPENKKNLGQINNGNDYGKNSEREKEKKRKKTQREAERTKRRHNRFFAKEMDELYRTAFIRRLYLGSYTLVFILWAIAFAMMLLSETWELILAIGGVSSMLIVAASRIIPLIKQSYERSMIFPELSCFILKIKGENPNDIAMYEYEIEMPGFQYSSRRMS
jgi:hypothetical protein